MTPLPLPHVGDMWDIYTRVYGRALSALAADKAEVPRSVWSVIIDDVQDNSTWPMAPNTLWDQLCDAVVDI